MNVSRQPFLSIITSHLDDLDSLLITAGSIETQTSGNHEWIVVDGASADPTVGSLQSLSSITTLISESDTGIYDAFNKGTAVARGEWIIFLGAGDTFVGSDVLSRLEEELRNLPSDAELAYGNAFPDSASSTAYSPTRPSWRRGRPVVPHHQSICHRARIFEHHRFDCAYSICADAKLILEVEAESQSARHIDLDMVVYDTKGVSNKRRSLPRIFKENCRIVRELGIQEYSLDSLVDRIVTCAKVAIVRVLYR